MTTLEPYIYLKQLRLETEMTQAQTAKFLGISERHYQRMENGAAGITGLHINLLEKKAGMLPGRNTKCPCCGYYF